MKPQPKKLGHANGWICVMTIKRAEVPSSCVAVGIKAHCEAVARRLNVSAALDVLWVAKEEHR